MRLIEFAGIEPVIRLNVLARQLKQDYEEGTIPDNFSVDDLVNYLSNYEYYIDKDEIDNLLSDGAFADVISSIEGDRVIFNDGSEEDSGPMDFGGENDDIFGDEESMGAEGDFGDDEQTGDNGLGFQEPQPDVSQDIVAGMANRASKKASNSFGKLSGVDNSIEKMADRASKQKDRLPEPPNPFTDLRKQSGSKI